MTDRSTYVDGDEPSADQRAAARELYRFFVALTDQGFTESHAIRIVANMVSSLRPDDD